VPGSVVDLVLIALIIMFAINGYRQGFLIGALSFCGFFGGALVGLQIAPWIVDKVDSAFMRVVISLTAVFGLAILGQMAAGWAGGRIRRAITNPQGQRADDIGGVFVSVLALLIVSWMVAGPLASSSLPSLSSSVRNSIIIQAVDAVMPSEARILYNRLRDTIAGGEFPNVFGDLTPTRARDVPAPDPALVGSPVVANARGSVAKITGTAPQCRRRIEGSGFVYAPERVMTNAHVVAGTRGALTIEVGDESRSGQVVLYDPQRDLAVVYVPGLRAPPMTWAAELAQPEDDAIVVGYPLDGPFTPVSARIRDVSNVKGPDIYEEQTVIREVYTIRSRVQSGNSGGPLLDTEGQLLGVIFAAALDNPEVGFALTVNEAKPAGDLAASLTEPTDTGPCT
jgi:S1-C subfamily serine protease